MTNNSLWHEVSENEKEQIRKDSKKLLNEFASKLDKIKGSESHFQNESGTREEGDGWTTDPEFKSTMISNAPFAEDGFIVAEKGAWK